MSLYSDAKKTEKAMRKEFAQKHKEEHGITYDDLPGIVKKQYKLLRKELEVLRKINMKLKSHK